MSPELARSLTEISLEIGRQVGLLLDRRGKVQDVFVGDAKQITISGVGRYRAGHTRLRGLRMVHTHLKGESLTQDDLTDLALLRFDVMAALEVTPQGLPGKVFWAHLLPGVLPKPNQDKDQVGSPWRLETAANVQSLPQDFLDFITALENEWSVTRDSGREAGKKTRRAVLVGITNRDLETLNRHMEELQSLAESADIEVVEVVQQRRPKLDPRFVVGSGKMKDLYIRCMQLQAELLIFEGELSASQVRAISDFGELEVWDRTQLILNIFSKRAHSRGGKLQVELAMLKYTLPRLVMRDDFLSRLTGGIGARGPGETKMEVLARRIRDRVTRLERELQQLSSERRLRRQRRNESSNPTVSIVGYTNAGKSTLLNSLTHAGVLAEHRMFATLDPTSRRLQLPSGQAVILTDTVGFIRDLPSDLAKAFRATLEELSDADVLLHLVDGSNPDFPEQIASVEDILGDLALDNIPCLMVFNKADLISPENLEQIKERWPHAPFVSALNNASLGPALEALEKLLHAQPVPATLHS